MKKDIHPSYQEVTVTCGCGNTFSTRSTAPKIAVEVCANCHPFFTGKEKLLDTAGMVERFSKRWTGEAAQKAKAATAPKVPAKKVVVGGRVQQTLGAQLPGGEKKPAAPPAKPEGSKPEGSKPEAPKAAAPAAAPKTDAAKPAAPAKKA